MAVGAVLAISGSSRQINRKASEPVSDRVRPEPGRHKYIIAVSDNGTSVGVDKPERIRIEVRTVDGRLQTQSEPQGEGS